MAYSATPVDVSSREEMERLAQRLLVWRIAPVVEAKSKAVQEAGRTRRTGDKTSRSSRSKCQRWCWSWWCFNWCGPAGKAHDGLSQRKKKEWLQLLAWISRVD